jgi:hypothetical protein
MIFCKSALNALYIQYIWHLFFAQGLMGWYMGQSGLEDHFHGGKYSWYSFLLEAESTPGPQCGRKDYVIEKFQ